MDTFKVSPFRSCNQLVLGQSFINASFINICAVRSLYIIHQPDGQIDEQAASLEDMKTFIQLHQDYEAK